MEDYITLVSGDENEFIILKSCAKHSKLLKGMLEESSGPFSMDTVPLPEISGQVLEMICQYLNQKELNPQPRFKPLSLVDGSTKSGQDIVFELLLASNYLDC